MDIAGVQQASPGGSQGKKRIAAAVGAGVLILVLGSLLLGGRRFVGTEYPVKEFFGVSSLALSPDGQLLAVGYTAGRLDLHDANSGAHLRTLDVSGAEFNWVSALAFNRDGSVLASGNWDKRLRFWDPHTGQAARPTIKHRWRVAALAWDPSDRSGKRLALGGAGLEIVDTGSGEVQVFGGGLPQAVAYSPDGATLASIGERGWGILWDPDSGEQRIILEGEIDHDNQSVTLAVSPDGRQVATATGETVELWDLATGSLERSLPGHPGAGGLNCLAYSPDGRLLASSGDLKGRGVRLWNTQTGALVKEFQAHERDGDAAVVWALVFTQDGRLFAGHRQGFTAWDY